MNRKPSGQIPKGDLFYTPKSLVWVAEDIIKGEFVKGILEPCAGQNHYPIVDALEKFGFSVDYSDLYDSECGRDYLDNDPWWNDYDQIITNPPFSLFDLFVMKAKTHCKKFMFIGRLNILGTQARYERGLFDNLKAIYPFTRYVDYRTPYRTDGHFYVGGMVTAWFLWDMEYTGSAIMQQLDVQKYATLGWYKE